MQHRTETPGRAAGQAREQGFVLVTAVIFIFVLSTLAVMALRGSLFDERMSANDRDIAVAREFAEMALRDAERDILGLRFDGTFCAATPGCTTKRPDTTRPKNVADTKTFWTVPAIYDASVDIALDDGGASEGALARKGIYTFQSATACGKPVWQAANWNDGVTRQCTGTITASVPTIEYGTFTDAPFGGDTPKPRYMIEMIPARDLMGSGTSTSKVFFRITAVGFGRSVGPFGNRTSATLQTVFSPL